MSKDWYQLKIEAPLRGLVKHLRNNGINTVISCAHEMYIKCHWSGEHDVRDIAYLVKNHLQKEHGEDHVNFDVESRCEFHFGAISYPLIEIRLYLIKEQKSYLLAEKRRITKKGVKQMTPRQIRSLPPKTRAELLRINGLLSELKDLPK